MMVIILVADYSLSVVSDLSGYGNQHQHLVTWDIIAARWKQEYFINVCSDYLEL